VFAHAAIVWNPCAGFCFCSHWLSPRGRTSSTTSSTQALLRARRAETEALAKDPKTKAAAERALGLLRDPK
jgi:hypothetical protein